MAKGGEKFRARNWHALNALTRRTMSLDERKERSRNFCREKIEDEEFDLFLEEKEQEEE